MGIDQNLPYFSKSCVKIINTQILFIKEIIRVHLCLTISSNGSIINKTKRHIDENYNKLVSNSRIF